MKVFKSVKNGLKVALVVTVSSVALSGQVQAAKLDPLVEKDLVKVCQAISDNDKIAFRKAVKQGRFNYKMLADGLVCNGQDMLTFVASQEAEDVSTYLAKRLNLSDRALTASR